MNHTLIDKRSLEMGRLIAARLQDDPSLIHVARENLDRWTATSAPGALAVLLEWKQVLQGPLDTVIELLGAEDERSTRMRQSNPFAGVLTAQERNAVLRKFQANDSAAT